MPTATAMAWCSSNRFDQPQPLDSALFPSEHIVGYSLLTPSHLPPCMRGFHVPSRPRHWCPSQIPVRSQSAGALSNARPYSNASANVPDSSFIACCVATVPSTGAKFAFHLIRIRMSAGLGWRHFDGSLKILPTDDGNSCACWRRRLTCQSSVSDRLSPKPGMPVNRMPFFAFQ